MSDIKFANYGQDRDLNCTDEEAQIFGALQEYFQSINLDPNQLHLVRRSGSYVTAVFRGWDLARFKYTPRAKWIAFPSVEVGPPKHRISTPDEAVSFADLLTESIRVITK